MDAIRPWLYIGKYRDTLNERRLKATGISAVLQLAEAISYENMTSRYIAIEDGEPIPHPLLQQGIDFIVNAQSQGQTVLVACGAGISRSATFAAAALKEIENLSLVEALRSIKQNHVETLPHPMLWKSLCAFYHEDFSVADMMRALSNRDDES